MSPSPKSISFPAKQESNKKTGNGCLDQGQPTEDASLRRSGVSVKDAVGVEDLRTIFKWDLFRMQTMLHWLLCLIGA